MNFHLKNGSTVYPLSWTIQSTMANNCFFLLPSSTMQFNPLFFTYLQSSHYSELKLGYFSHFLLTQFLKVFAFGSRSRLKKVFSLLDPFLLDRGIYQKLKTFRNCMSSLISCFVHKVFSKSWLKCHEDNNKQRSSQLP